MKTYLPLWCWKQTSILPPHLCHVGGRLEYVRILQILRLTKFVKALTYSWWGVGDRTTPNTTKSDNRTGKRGLKWKEYYIFLY